MQYSRRFTATTGLALFSMFFGSGNLVFPLLIGQSVGDQTLIASIGLIITAVIMPFLGCFGILLYNGNPKQFFSFLGEKGYILFAFASLALMGPFGVLARCLTVAYGTFATFDTTISIEMFSAISCVLLFVAAISRTKILEVLGTWLTPLLLLSLFGIVFFSLGIPTDTTLVQPLEAFTLGVHQGYQTMDLLAAFFFSGFVVSILPKDHNIKTFSGASLIAGTLLACVYASLVYLGSAYAQELTNVSPQSMLAVIAAKSMGAMGSIVVCAAFALACYTTALVLTVLFADFIRIEFSQNKMPNWLALTITLAIAFGVSTLEFSGIASFLGPILETVYPMLIVITFVNIIRRLYSWKYSTTG